MRGKDLTTRGAGTESVIVPILLVLRLSAPASGCSGDGICPDEGNAEQNKMGWRIIKTLTDHPALDDFETIADFV